MACCGTSQPLQNGGAEEEAPSPKTISHWAAGNRGGTTMASHGTSPPLQNGRVKEETPLPKTISHLAAGDRGSTTIASRGTSWPLQNGGAEEEAPLPKAISHRVAGDRGGTIMASHGTRQPLQNGGAKEEAPSPKTIPHRAAVNRGGTAMASRRTSQPLQNGGAKEEAPSPKTIPHRAAVNRGGTAMASRRTSQPLQNGGAKEEATLPKTISHRVAGDRGFTTTVSCGTSRPPKNDRAEEEAPSPKTISHRAHQMLSCPTFSVHYGKEIERNLYNKQDNPKGIVNMGQAINRLMEEETLARLNKGDALTMTAHHQYYFDSFGIPKLRQAVASFLTRHHKPYKPISPDNLIVMNGVTACLDALSYTLCDPDDVVIAPTPVYGRIFTYFHERSRAIVVPLVTMQEENFELQAQELEKLIQEIKSEGRCVRACVIVHPNNPLGYIFPTSHLRNIMEICAQHEVHVIVDEIYAFSIHDKETKFNSVLGIASLPDPLRTHVLWGLSKDFSVPGFRLGMIHSLNPWVLSCLKTLSQYHSTPQLLQHAAATVMNDTEWCDGFYIPTNQKKLAEAYHKARQHLEAMGVVVKKYKAGLYLWVNMQAFLQPCTVESEQALFLALLNGGVIISPGQTLHCLNPGWFRIVFAVTNEELDVGLSRVEAVLSTWKRHVKSNSS